MRKRTPAERAYRRGAQAGYKNTCAETENPYIGENRGDYSEQATMWLWGYNAGRNEKKISDLRTAMSAVLPWR